MWLLLLACRERVSYTTSIEPEHPWAVEEADASWAARFEAARSYHASVGGLSMLVVHQDALVYEEYANGNAASTPHPLWSGTKTFACALAMEGVEQGLLTLDEPVSDTLEIREEQQDMQIRHLLNFTSGVEHDFWALQRDSWYADQHTEDKVAYTLAQPQAHPPGEVFEYSPVHLLLFSGLMEEKLDGDVLDWLDAQVLSPIGFRWAGWQRDPSGTLLVHLGTWTTAAEWLRFGVLLRDDGMWEGERVLPEGTLATCGTGSTPNPAYGLSVWLNQPVGSDDPALTVNADIEEEGPIFHAEGHTDLVVAAGASGQRLYVIPQEQLVVALLSDSRDFSDVVFLDHLLLDP
ncbi:MAG TPA: serine hydrolase [Myxococcota bacterium]|nr:serine hydrolase [Myxococcota bacterium]